MSGLSFYPALPHLLLLLLLLLFSSFPCSSEIFCRFSRRSFLGIVPQDLAGLLSEPPAHHVSEILSSSPSDHHSAYFSEHPPRSHWSLPQIMSLHIPQSLPQLMPQKVLIISFRTSLFIPLRVSLRSCLRDYLITSPKLRLNVFLRALPLDLTDISHR